MAFGFALSPVHSAIAAAWSPASLFTTGEQGVWYDPSDFSTLFQDSAGTTPVTAVEQPVGKMLDKSGRGNHATQATSASRTIVSARVNAWQYTEDVASNRYAAGSSTKQTDTVSFNGITLTRVSMASFYSSLRSQVGGLGLAPFIAGQRYLVSCYVKSAAEQFMWMRPLDDGGTPGHGAKLLTTTPRRIWILAQATSTSALTTIRLGATALGGEAGLDPYWLFQGSTEGGAGEVYIGGFQIELVNGAYKDGIALIGDSTMEGSSGATDSSATNAREVSMWLGALLNVNVFNRATGGEQTSAMDARWATDISPLAVNCRYAIIQGGINDIANSRPLADIQASITSMVNKATADGLIPVVFNCSPTASIAAFPAKEADRVALNIWIAATFTNTLDIATILADPANPSLLNPLWAGDGVHYTTAGKKAVAYAAASSNYWSFTAPSRYQRVPVATDYDTVGFPVADKFDGVNDSQATTTGGGATTAFFWCGSIKAGKIGAAQTLFSDAGANTGYIVRINASNQLELAAGNGTAYTLATSVATLAVGQTAVLTAWDDGVNLNVQIDNVAVASVARPVVSAGTAAITIGKDNGAATSFFLGSIYEKIYVKDDVQTAAQISSAKTYCAQKALVTL